MKGITMLTRCNVQIRQISRMALVSAAMAVQAVAQTPPAATPAAASAPPGSQPVGQSSAGGGAGSTVFFESQMLSYGSLGQITKRIAATVCQDLGGKAPVHLVLFDTTSFLTAQQFYSFAKEVEFLTSLFQSFGGPRFTLSETEDLAKAVRGDLRKMITTPDATAQAAGAPALQVAEGIFQTLSGVIGASKRASEQQS
jgi:hypothetical protein